MAESLGVSSNSADDLFQELSDWNQALKEIECELDGLE